MEPVATDGLGNYTREISVGGTGRILFTLAATYGIKRVRVSVGSEDFWINVDEGLRVRALSYNPTRVGAWPLYVHATDSRGCEGATGLRRMVTVK